MIKVDALSQEQIREINRVNIIHILRDRDETTKQEIAKILGLSIPTVTTNINLLIDEGLVEEAGVAKSTGGRKPVILKFIADARLAFGVDITPDRVQMILLNLEYDIIDKTEFDYRAYKAFDKVLNEIERQIKLMIKKHSISKNRVVGLGLSLPGLVDETQLILNHAPNIGVKNYCFKDFEKQLGIKVSIENEANVAAFAESVLGEAKGKANLVYISITEGVGTGIIINDHIFKSTHKKAGEFGHMRVSTENRLCNCGRTGCWELYASKKALRRYYGDSEAKVSTIFEAVGQKEEKAEVAVKEYLKHLFVGIENIILGLNPEYVIIGGEMGKYEEELTRIIGEMIDLKSDFVEYEGTKILFSTLGDESALMGAALLPLEDVLNYQRNII